MFAGSVRGVTPGLDDARVGNLERRSQQPEAARRLPFLKPSPALPDRIRCRSRQGMNCHGIHCKFKAGPKGEKRPGQDIKRSRNGGWVCRVHRRHPWLKTLSSVQKPACSGVARFSFSTPQFSLYEALTVHRRRGREAPAGLTGVLFGPARGVLDHFVTRTNSAGGTVMPAAGRSAC
jgi:hypothetical protein